MKTMSKKITAIVVLLLVILLTCTPAVFAADSKVTYVGSANKFVLVPTTTDLFQNFKGVMPGDTLTQNIKVKNDTANNVKVKLYLKAEPVDEQYIDFLSKLTMTVTQNGSTNLFSAPANEQGGLTSNVCLGTFYSGAEVDLKVTLNVPTTMGNDYQNSIGIIKWVFSAEEFPIDPDDPETGDKSNITLYIILALVSVGALVLLFYLWKKKALIKNN